MPFAKTSSALMNITAPVTTVQTGTKYRVSTSPLDGLEDAVHGFGVAFHVDVTGGTSPTADCRLEGSYDNLNWYIIETMTQLVGAGSRDEHKEIAVRFIPPYIRAVLTPGGTAAGDTTAKVMLTSPARFELAAQAQ